MSTMPNRETHFAGRADRASRETLTGSRLRKHADFQRVYAQGKKRRSINMNWFLAPHAETTSRVGLTVGKVLGKAHDRNRIKRRMREVLRRHMDQLPAGCDLVLHPRKSVLTLEFAKLEAEIVRILQQANAELNRATSIRPEGSHQTGSASGAGTTAGRGAAS